MFGECLCVCMTYMYVYKLDVYFIFFLIEKIV